MDVKGWMGEDGGGWGRSEIEPWMSPRRRGTVVENWPADVGRENAGLIDCD